MFIGLKMNPDLDDLFSHRSAWGDALFIARDKATSDDDRSYWEHEIKVFNRTFELAEKLKPQLLELHK